MTIRSRMSSILDLIGPEHLELFALDFKKIAIFHTKLNKDIHDNKISDEFDFMSNRTIITGIICP